MKFLDRYENISCIVNIYWDILDGQYIARNANNPDEILFFLNKDLNNINLFNFQYNITDIEFKNEATIELKGLTESVSQKVKIHYTNINIDGTKKVAFKYIDHKSSVLYTELKEDIILPFEDPYLGVLDEIHIDEVIHDVILDYTITNKDILIINEEEFRRRANPNYHPYGFQNNEDNEDVLNRKKVLWLFDKNKYVVCEADISFITEGKYKEHYCIKLKSNSSMYVKKDMLDEFLKAEKYINRNIAINKHKMIMEFLGSDKKFFLSDVEISTDPFKIFGVDYYRVKYHSGYYEFLKKNELERRIIFNYKNISSRNIVSWDDKIYKLSVIDKVELVWCFYLNNRETENEYIYSEYKVLNFILSDSAINNDFIELYNIKNQNKFGLDITSFSNRLCSINGETLPGKTKSKEYALKNSSRDKNKMIEYI